jgi:hypothetical protein
MAAIPSSYITYTRRWSEGGQARKDRTVNLIVITVPKSDATAYGDATNTVPATIFGLKVLEECDGAVDNLNNLVICSPSFDGVNVLTYDITNATDATRNAPAAMFKRIDINTPGVFYLQIKGY